MEPNSSQHAVHSIKRVFLSVGIYRACSRCVLGVGCRRTVAHAKAQTLLWERAVAEPCIPGSTVRTLQFICRAMTNLCKRPNLESCIKGCSQDSERLRLLLCMSTWDCSQHIMPGSAVLFFPCAPYWLAHAQRRKTRIDRNPPPEHSSSPSCNPGNPIDPAVLAGPVLARVGDKHPAPAGAAAGQLTSVD